MTIATLVQNLLVSVVAVIGLIVLIALGDVSASTGVPIIAALAGVHVGANLSSTTSVTGVTGNSPTLPHA